MHTLPLFSVRHPRWRQGEKNRISPAIMTDSPINTHARKKREKRLGHCNSNPTVILYWKGGVIPLLHRRVLPVSPSAYPCHYRKQDSCLLLLLILLTLLWKPRAQSIKLNYLFQGKSYSGQKDKSIYGERYTIRHKKIFCYPRFSFRSSTITVLGCQDWQFSFWTNNCTKRSILSYNTKIYRMWQTQ